MTGAVPTVTTVSMEFLGTFSVSRDDMPIRHFRGNKVRGLLAYLATEAGRAHSRTSLADLLWSDRTEETSLRNLSQSVVRLRGALADTAEPSQLLAITRSAIEWRGQCARVDVLDFARLVRSSDPVDLERASALYRGEFLPGFDLPDTEPFEEWLLLTRAQLQQQALTALHTLADHYLAARQWPPAVAAAQRAIELDPWREVAHRQLMRALAEGGDRAAALEQFERCRSVLADDLGVEPDEETLSLYERILAHDLAPAALDPPSARPGLPTPLTPFVGRETEVPALTGILARGDVRLLTLVGTGGMGKTRLALEIVRTAAGRARHGTVFVPLAPLSDVEGIPAAIARAIGVTLHGTDLVASLLRFLRETPLLLILDNMEHLAGGAALVVDILEAAPDVRIIVTSRRQLGVRGEHVYRVEGLEYGRAAPHADVISPAARLFIQSARRAHAGFVMQAGDLLVIEHIGALLGGMPLGLEMAAPWVGLLSLVEIAHEIERSLDFLRAEWAGTPERQRSMRAVFEWSWRLLGNAEQAVLRRLSVFRGGFTREAAETVAGANLHILAILSHASFVRWHLGDGDGRYKIHKLLRQFAAEQLDMVPGERERIEARHGAYYLALAEEAAAEYSGPQQVTWLDRLERDHDNILAALERFGTRSEIDLELRLVGATGYLWFIRGYHTAEAEHLLRTLARPEAQAPTAARSRALNAAGYLQWIRGNLPEAHALLTESVANARTVGDEQDLAFGLCYLGMVRNAQGEYGAADAVLQESLTRWDALGNRMNMGLSLMFMGDAALGRHDWAGAHAALTDSVDLFRATGNVSVLPYPLRRLGYLALREHDDDRAMTLYQESLAVNREVGDRQGIAASLVGLAAVAEARHQPDRAVRLLGAAEVMVEKLQTKLLLLDGEECERITETVRSQLDAATFAEAWAAGRAMTLEQAVNAARGWAAMMSQSTA